MSDDSEAKADRTITEAKELSVNICKLFAKQNTPEFVAYLAMRFLLYYIRSKAPSKVLAAYDELDGVAAKIPFPMQATTATQPKGEA